MTEPLQAPSAFGRLRSHFRGMSMRLTTTITLAASLVALAACNKSATENNLAENNAMNATENTEMTANAVNETMNAGNETNAVENNAAGNTSNAVTNNTTK